MSRENKKTIRMELQATVVNKYLEKITDFGFEYVPKLIGGILVLFIGL
jgi:small conductance mechanosensitive channel